MTDKEIIKALEFCCNNGHCKKCPHCCANGENIEDLALDLINRQKAEIEMLYETLDYRAEKIRDLQDMVAQNEGVLPRYENLIKAEAIKEFAERLKEKYSQADILCPRRIVSLTEKDLDNIVKEMEKKLSI